MSLEKILDDPKLESRMMSETLNKAEVSATFLYPPDESIR